MKTDILLCLVGLLGGIINSVAGGGAVIIFPALLAAGVPALNANATSSLIVWPGALTSAYGYRKHLGKLPRYYFFLLIPCAIGAVIGSIALKHTNNTDFEKLAPWLVLLAITLLAIQPRAHKLLTRGRHNISKHPFKVLGVVALALFPLAIYGGYFGAGFGIMMLAFLGFTNLTDLQQMNGLKNLAAASIAIISTVYFAAAGLIYWRSGLVMFAGNAVGGFLGAHYAQKIPASLIRWFIIAIGIAIVIALVLKDR